MAPLDHIGQQILTVFIFVRLNSPCYIYIINIKKHNIMDKYTPYLYVRWGHIVCFFTKLPRNYTVLKNTYAVLKLLTAVFFCFSVKYMKLCKIAYSIMCVSFP